jgi:hypothetical protein
MLLKGNTKKCVINVLLVLVTCLCTFSQKALPTATYVVADGDYYQQQAGSKENNRNLQSVGSITQIDIVNAEKGVVI